MPTHEGFIVLGGVNLNSYCTMRVHTLSILNYGKEGVLKDDPPPKDEKTEPLNKENLERRIDELNMSPVKAQRTHSVYTESRMGAFEDNVIFDFEMDSTMYNMWKIAALQNNVKEKIDIVKHII
jgi:hypothetical protein